MASKRTDEYRREAVDYVPNSGKTIEDCAKGLGINDKTLSNWVSNFKKEGRTGSGMTAGEKEPAEADKRIREPGMENASLKKAAAFFAKSQA